MDIKQILDKLEKFESKCSKTQEEECQSYISQLLETSDGIEELHNLLEPKIEITEWVQKIIVSKISQLDPAKPAYGTEVTRLLEAISKNGRVNSNARWKALSVILNANLPNSRQIFADVLERRAEEKKDLSKKYLEYAFENIIPDGGLPYLLDLYIQNPTKYEWLPDLLVQVSDRLYKEKSSIDRRSLDKIKSYLDAKKLPFKKMDRPLILLATKSPDTLHTTLESVLDKLSTEDSKTLYWKEVVEERIREALGEDVETEPKPSVEEPVEEKEKPTPTPSTGTEEAIKLLTQILTQDSGKLEGLIKAQNKSREDEHRRIETRITQLLSRLEDRDRAARLQDQLSRKRKEKAELQHELDEARRFSDELDQENNRLKNIINKAQRKIKKLSSEKEELIEENELLENKIQRVIDQAENIKQDFCHELGGKLSPDFIEAKDSSYKPDSVEEEILLEKLRNILKKLEKSGVIIA